MPAPELTPTQLTQLHASLKEKQQLIEAQLVSANPDTKPVILDQQSVGRLSRMDAIQQQQMALANKQQSSEMLIYIKRALQRVDSGDYGFCLECEDPVAFARLQAQPFARLCIDCQSASEST